MKNAKLNFVAYGFLLLAIAPLGYFFSNLVHGEITLEPLSFFVLLLGICPCILALFAGVMSNSFRDFITLKDNHTGLVNLLFIGLLIVYFNFYMESNFSVTPFFHGFISVISLLLALALLKLLFLTSKFFKQKLIKILLIFLSKFFYKGIFGCLYLILAKY